MANVKIALRIRPLSEKEKIEDELCQKVVDVEDGKTVAITNLKVPMSNAGDSRARIKRFTFDYCFDSSSLQDNFVNQEMIYEKLGSVVLDSLARGQNACVLAYGQSSSGKTYTMQGSLAEPGLAPRLCRALMDKSENIISEASVSFFEIYNERVRDLLAGDDLQNNDSVKNFAKKDLRVREHPKKGPYVEELSGVVVKNGEELCSVWSSGAKRRRTAPTATNLRSSRSHALLYIKRLQPYPPVTLTLLDLAGSERPSRVNQSLPRQKEGANINKSLVALANVISALVAAGPRGGRYVPYRDSVLTWLLKDTLSGSTTTVMIATVSPSASCYSETVNTMRWASRAARIPATSGQLPSSEAPHERAIRQLRAEVDQLKSLLAAATLKKPPYVSKFHTDSKSFFTTLPVFLTRILQQADSESVAETMNPPPADTEEQPLKETEIDESSENKIELFDHIVKEENLLDETERAESGDSLGSSRASIASVETLSGNNSVPSINWSALNSSQAEDTFFGPRLHRTGSAHEVKPLLRKKRQYSSHEVLPSHKPTFNKTFKSNSISKPKKPNSNTSESPKSISPKTEETITESAEDKNKTEVENKTKTQQNQPFNKRAEIVASVTDRLYTKLRKKEEEKMMKNMLAKEKQDNKQLTELQLCNNARKKLFDISHRALWASKRFRVGVSTETQTSKPLVLRVRNVATDVPSDLEPFEINSSKEHKLYRNASVATENYTKVCKEISVGTPCGSVYMQDKSVLTDKTSDFATLVITRSCGNMTENTALLNSACTQTDDSMPNRKHSSFTKYLKVTHEPPGCSNPSANECNNPSVLNISISHDCAPFENEIEGISDDSLDSDSKSSPPQTITAPPDLLHNHNASENSADNQESTQEIEAPPVRPKRENQSLTSKYFALKKKQSDSVVNAEGEGCSYITNGVEGAIKFVGVTQNTLLTVKTDTVNKKSGQARHENKNCESKSTQVYSIVDDAVSDYVDFLDDVYVPLPRIYFSQEYASDRWPTMKNLILGRNENVYPYNIKLSPRRESPVRRRSSKTVSWKPDEPLLAKLTSERLFGKPILKSIYKNNAAYLSASESEAIDSDDILTDTIDTRCKSNIGTKYFKGIYCWGDRVPVAPPRRKASQIDKENTVKYVEATSSLLNEATNLVTVLSKVSNQLSHTENTPEQKEEKRGSGSTSPVCNSELHIQDDEELKCSSSDQNNDPCPKVESDDPSFCAVNGQLTDNEEQPKDDNADEDVKSTEDVNIAKNKVEEVEKNLLASLNRLEMCTKSSKKYFDTIGDKYKQKFRKELPKSVNHYNMYQNPRSPRKYLQQLLEMRKELVDCTMRDEDISKQFQYG